MSPRKPINTQRVLELFYYQDGRLYRKDGSKTGYDHPFGYRKIKMDGTHYMEHRLVWAMHRGDIDHINGDRGDNRIENLRLATRSENGRNRKANSNSISGFKGVTFNKGRGKWQAQIEVHGTGIYLGSRDTAEEAADLYDAWSRKLFGEFAKPNFEGASIEP